MKRPLLGLAALLTSTAAGVPLSSQLDVLQVSHDAPTPPVSYAASLAVKHPIESRHRTRNKHTTRTSYILTMLLRHPCRPGSQQPRCTITVGNQGGMTVSLSGQLCRVFRGSDWGVVVAGPGAHGRCTHRHHRGGTGTPEDGGNVPCAYDDARQRHCSGREVL